MKHYHKNPRQITKRQFEQLQEWLAELGDLGGIVHDLNSDECIGGNQRVRALGLEGIAPVITQRFDPPTEQGTVALGYYEANGERYGYRAVRWTPEQCEKANIVANKAGGGWDWDILANEWDVDNLLEWGFEAEELGIDLTPGPPERAVDKVFTDDQVVETAFEYFRAAGFPYRNLPIHVSMQQINKLAQTKPDKLLHTTMGYHVADTYHPHRFHASAEGMKSPLEAFEDDKLLLRALNLQLEQNNSVPDTYFGKLEIVGGTQACANFRPGFACYLYRKYASAGDTVLDCSTGYGGRLVGFMASGVAGNYIGIDPNKATHNGNARMCQEFGFAGNVELYNLPAEDVDIETLRERCDFAFTSPPYFAKEHYSDEDTQSWKRYKTGEEWRDRFLLPFMRLQIEALKPGRQAVVNIADVKLRGKIYPLVQWCKECAEAVGFEYESTDYFELTNRFGAGQDDEVAKEEVLIFRKS